MNGVEPFTVYVTCLKDRVAVAKLQSRLHRLELGNLGDYKSAGDGILELRIDWGPGYRIYIGLRGEEAIVLTAGDKNSQNKNIVSARQYWDDYRRDR